MAGLNFSESSLVISTMIEMLSPKNQSLNGRALDYIGSILNSSDPRILEKCMLNGLVDKLANLLYSSDTIIVKKALWAISNFCCSG